MQVATILGLKSFQNHVEKHFFENSGDRINKEKLEALRIAEKDGLFNKFMKEQLGSTLGRVLEEFQLVKDPSFKALNRETRYEILKASVISPFKYNSNNEGTWTSVKKGLERNAEWLELKFIMNYFDIMIYDNRTADIVCKNSFKFQTAHQYQSTLEEYYDLDSISCNKGSSNCVTLVVEDKEIHVISFLLTSNSPVFKAMLDSNSFKEGQSKRIELPGKKFNEIAYFLQCLCSPQEIGSITGK